MFTTPSPAAPTLSTSTSQAAPTSPTRPSRLRGLSYLRSYTSSHLHPGSQSSSVAASTHSHPRVTRSNSSPSVTDPLRPDNTESTPEAGANPSISVGHEASSIQHNSSSGITGGWLPSVGLRSSLVRVHTQPETFSRDTGDTTADGNVAVATGTSDSMRAMTRNRAETAAPSVPATRALSQTQRTTSAPEASDGTAPTKETQLPTIRLSPHQDTRSNRPSLAFPSVSRTLPSPSSVIRVGRYSERDSSNGFMNDPNPSAPSQAPVGFKSKVVSRRHCEFWCQKGQWYIKDVGSSSGTFLNHIRLSQPGVESKPYVVNDGDVVQLGIDFRGGEEMIFRCVKIRVECNRGWQKGLNNFNKQTHKRLRNLAKKKPRTDGDNASTHTSECSICLMSIAPCQSLFVAPCSHVWHYKCIRPILNGQTWPNFLCPNCRAVADLEADVDEDDVGLSEDEDTEQDSDIRKAIEESLRESKGPDGERTNADGEAMRSIDVTEARHEVTGSRPVSIGPSSVLDAAIGPTTSSRASSQGSIPRGRAGFGGLSDSIRILRSPRSNNSSSSARPTRRQDDSPAGDAELAALVAQNMHLGAPSRTPPPPPKDKPTIDVSGSRRASTPMDTPDTGTTPRIAGYPRSASYMLNTTPLLPSPHTPRVPYTDQQIEGAMYGDRVGMVNGEDMDVDADATQTDFGRSITITSHDATEPPGRTRRPRDNAPSGLPRQNSNELSLSRELGTADCPMTPRNDAGPFILDGSGGRSQ